MKELIFGILSSTFILVLFRVFPKYKVNTFQAVVFNYFTACTFGLIFYGNQFNQQAFQELSWLPYSIISGILLIALFLVIGISAQKNGISFTSIVSKMSMSVAVCLMILFYKEPLTLLKISGIALAFVGIISISWKKSSKGIKRNTQFISLLIFLFVGGGILDFIFNYTQNYHLKNLSTPLFSAISFGFSGLIGISILMIQITRKKQHFHYRNVIAGILLGVPNFFSVYLLMSAYSTLGWNDSTVITVMNVSVVLMAFFIGVLIFKESFTRLKAFGLFASLTSIILLYLASI
ncbi:MAG: DMT family transporter [Crocinitomicaceae bacterium]|nr:DMT family transporter [Crocinitomicaceae bacterium]